MADDKNHRDLMRYDLMAQDALRGVVKQALKRAASAQGIPGEHHFYISFQTQAPGVSVPEELVERYPDEMTIVLQHEFWELAPGETFFSVVLRFGGQPKKLSIPYAAVTRFHDPSVPFALQFEPVEIEAAETKTEPAEPEMLKPKPKAVTSETESPQPDDDGPKIVSLDQFRKSDPSLTDVSTAEPAAVTDEALLARFQNAKNRPPGTETLGFRMLRVDQANKEIEVAFEGRREFTNPAGQIQGGFLCAMLDETMSVAGVVASGMSAFMPTLEMKTSFLRPALPGRLICTGRVVKWGKAIAFLEGELYDDQHRLLAKANATSMPQPFKGLKKVEA